MPSYDPDPFRYLRRRAVRPLALTLPEGGGAAAPVYSAEATAYFALMSVQPDTTRKGLIDTWIAAYKTAGIFAKHDVLYLRAAHDAQAARLNVIGDYSHSTAVGGPTFTVDRGYAGNGSSAYLDLNFNPGDGVVRQYKLNDAHISAWSRTEGDQGSIELGARLGVASREANFIIKSTGNFSPRLNQDNNGTFAAVPSALGSFVLRRSGASAYSVLRNGGKIADFTDASTGIPNFNHFELARNNAGTAGNFSPRQIAMSSEGASLSDAQCLAKYNADLALLQAIGAA